MPRRSGAHWRQSISRVPAQGRPLGGGHPGAGPDRQIRAGRGLPSGMRRWPWIIPRCRMAGQPTNQARIEPRYARTASTRRWLLWGGDLIEPAEHQAKCASTVLCVTRTDPRWPGSSGPPPSAPAPLAHARRARQADPSIVAGPPAGSRRRGRAGPPLATRRMASEKSSRSAMRSLSRSQCRARPRETAAARTRPERDVTGRGSRRRRPIAPGSRHGLQALVAVPGRIPMSTIATSVWRRDQRQELVGVARLADHLEPRLAEQAGRSLPDQQGVVGDHESQRARRWLGAHGWRIVARRST